MCPRQGTVGRHAIKGDIDQHAKTMGARAFGDVGQQTPSFLRAAETAIHLIGIVCYKNVAGSARRPDGGETDLIEAEFDDALELARPRRNWSG